MYIKNVAESDNVRIPKPAQRTGFQTLASGILSLMLMIGAVAFTTGCSPNMMPFDPIGMTEVSGPSTQIPNQMNIKCFNSTTFSEVTPDSVLMRYPAISEYSGSGYGLIRAIKDNGGTVPLSLDVTPDVGGTYYFQIKDATAAGQNNPEAAHVRSEARTLSAGEKYTFDLHSGPDSQKNNLESSSVSGLTLYTDFSFYFTTSAPGTYSYVGTALNRDYSAMSVSTLAINVDKALTDPATVVQLRDANGNCKYRSGALAAGDNSFDISAFSELISSGGASESMVDANTSAITFPSAGAEVVKPLSTPNLTNIVMDPATGKIKFTLKGAAGFLAELQFKIYNKAGQASFPMLSLANYATISGSDAEIEIPVNALSGVNPATLGAIAKFGISKKSGSSCSFQLANVNLLPDGTTSNNIPLYPIGANNSFEAWGMSIPGDSIQYTVNSINVNGQPIGIIATPTGTEFGTPAEVVISVKDNPTAKTVRWTFNRKVFYTADDH